jgi:3-hydroxyisobutyrate dehydrogenase
MALHLINKGYSLVVYNRTPSKAEDLIQAGAKYADSPRHVAQEADYLFLMLGYPKDVEDMVFCPEKGIKDWMKPGSFLIDHTTSSPGLAQKIADTMKEKGVSSIDAPVSGGDIGARTGKLVTMIGGDPESAEKCIPIMMSYSTECKLMGAPGAGQHTKMANQIFISTTMIGLCEGLLYGHKAGLKLDELIELLKKGAAGSASLERLGVRMLKRDFDPGFYVEHFVKDLGIVLQESKRMGLSLPGTALAEQLYIGLMA